LVKQKPKKIVLHHFEKQSPFKFYFLKKKATATSITEGRSFSFNFVTLKSWRVLPKNSQMS
jgi:hypothetical protein